MRRRAARPKGDRPAGQQRGHRQKVPNSHSSAKPPSSLGHAGCLARHESATWLFTRWRRARDGVRTGWISGLDTVVNPVGSLPPIADLASERWRRWGADGSRQVLSRQQITCPTRYECSRRQAPKLILTRLAYFSLPPWRSPRSSVSRVTCQ